MEVTIKKLEPKDFDEFVQLIRVFEEVFETTNLSMPSHQHLLKLLSKPDFMAFIAVKEEQIVGGLTAYTLDHIIQKNLSLIFTIWQ